MMNQNFEHATPVPNNQASNAPTVSSTQINTFKSIPTYLKIANIVRSKSF